LRHTYSNVKARTADWKKHGEFVVVSQKKYQLAEKHGLDDKMFMYLPNNCKKGGCRAVFFLHGCM
jgi:hypothetical protein